MEPGLSRQLLGASSEEVSIAERNQWVFHVLEYGGFHKWGYPQLSSISNDGIVPNRNHPFLLGVPPLMETPIWNLPKFHVVVLKSQFYFTMCEWEHCSLLVLDLKFVSKTPSEATLPLGHLAEDVEDAVVECHIQRHPQKKLDRSRANPSFWLPTHSKIKKDVQIDLDHGLLRRF